MSDEETERQRREINAFAAMANGDFDFASAGGDGTYDFKSQKSSRNTSNNGTDDEDDSDGGGHHRDENDDDSSANDDTSHRSSDDDDDDDDAGMDSFAKSSVQVESSGTFSRLASSSSGSGVDGSNSGNVLSKSNLEAAALALSQDSDLATDNNNGGSKPGAVGQTSSFGWVGGVPSMASTMGNKIPPKTPMHTQRVYLPRPLFFGPILPPRIVLEARRIVDEAIAEQVAVATQQQQQQQHQKHSSLLPQSSPPIPQIGLLPPQVRNLISSIQCYGYGIDIVPSSSNGQSDVVTDGTPVQTRGSSYVSVFCPKWSETAQSLTINESKGPPDSTAADNVDDDDNDDDPMSDDDDDDEDGSPTMADDTRVAGGTASSVGQYQDPDDIVSTGMSLSDTVKAVSGPSGQSTTSITSPKPKKNKKKNTFSVDSSRIERAMFSMFARGEGGGDKHGTQRGRRLVAAGRSRSIGSISGFLSNPVMTSVTRNAQISEKELVRKWLGEANPHNQSGDTTGTVYVNNAVRATGAKPLDGPSFFESGTFTNVGMSGDSDDDSVVDSEMKKKVGVSEHLNAALASLEADFRRNDAEGGGGRDADDGGEVTQQVPLTPDGGRPLSNHELMNGNSPMFGVDDPPLPSEGDLGSHQTRDEQQRSKEQRRTQAIIEKFCPLNVFGPLACPNAALDPDDTHTWNSMSTPMQRNQNLSAAAESNHRSKGGNSSQAGTSSDAESARHSAVTKRRKSYFATPHPQLFDSRTRYGWWNKGDDGDGLVPTDNGPAETSATDGLEDKNMDSTPEDPPLQLPPWEHAANSLFIQTRLQPDPETLHEQNRPLSELNPATTLAQALPFLSDRPPSYRYLQVDSQAVGFPNLGGEVEPLFCSVAIYHVETVAQSAGEGNMTPIPDLHRCGKVTETLNFDVVTDPDIERRCRWSLCPYSSEDDDTVHPQSTRCGVFPLPSNLSMHNLYAIITVSKVISEGSDFEPYLRPKASWESGRQDAIDLVALRARAGKAADHHGKFVMPFAFGVAPLVQVFGADVPRVPSSRAVQIPLFRFSSGNGEKQIIDHIMVMLQPKLDPRTLGVGGPAPVTNGGTAMLVMRNFGYLGLHEVVNSKSSLARDRLVDFTGEKQLRRRRKDDVTSSEAEIIQYNCGFAQVVPEWRSDYVAESVQFGGRCVHEEEQSKSQIGQCSSSLYALELAPLPLHTASLTRPSGSPSPVLRSRARGISSGEDIEPYFHTTFCNELVCNPRLLHNSPKGNIVVRVEIREMEWNTEFGVFLAHTPASGPMVHNPRRGPFLVQYAYTSSSARCIDPHFLDEFKVKLPLVLGKNGSRSSVIFFTVYRLSFSARKKWAFRFRAGKMWGRRSDEIAGEMAGEAGEVSGTSNDCHLIQLGCGFLPLEKQQSLLDDGNHDVRISHTARHPLPQFCIKHDISPDTLIVTDVDGSRDANDPDDGVTDDGESILDSVSATSAKDRDAASESVDGTRTKQHRRHPRMLLQVRISVQSSLHAQSATLSDFLSQDPDIALPLTADGGELKNMLRLGKDAILRGLNSTLVRPPSERYHYDEQRLLISTVDIAKSDLCSMVDVSSHLLRVCRQLWKVVVAGTGSHDLLWANPTSTRPLRVNAFASLLQILGSSTLYFSKRGVLQVTGKAKWNFVSLSRVMALVFDEEALFGKNGEEVLSEEFITKISGNSSGTEKEKKNIRRHVRSNFEFLNNGTAGGGTDSMSAVKNTSLDGKGLSKPASVTRSHTTGETKYSDISPLSTLERRGVQKETSPSPKMDSLTDFRAALEAGSRENGVDDEMYEKKNGGNPVAESWANAFGGSSGGASRRWMTAPSGLATIQEDADDDEQAVGINAPKEKQGPLDSLDSEIVRPPQQDVSRKQFRIPMRSTNPSASGEARSVAIETIEHVPKESFLQKDGDGVGYDIESETDLGSFDSPPALKEAPKEKQARRDQTLPATDAEIESAGTSFLDAIEKSLGLSNFQAAAEEAERVFGKHHRKTKSHSSIDWSIPNDDLSTLLADSASEEVQNEKDEHVEKFDESMGTLAQEAKLSLRLPSFIDRLSALGKGNTEYGRWFPYTYEIVIMLWVALLMEQQNLMLDHTKEHIRQSKMTDEEEALADAASRTSGAVIACAPVLFQVIKQSLGSRVTNLGRRLPGRILEKYPPLVTLDDVMLANLEQLIAIITDACLDSRNFDSWETRQTCIDVNDSIVCFLRDLYGSLEPSCVYRLVMVYWSRLVARDGRQWQDRDSSIGLRVSWEITKLQMSAITAFVRFPDFIKVNSPQMNSWSEWWLTASPLTNVNFFDNILEQYEKFGLPSILSDSTSQERMKLPRMRPHWLAEIVVDICLSGIEHAEQNIQRRSASLLLELFWSQGQQSLREEYSHIVASMYITFIEKVLSRTAYLATCFASKSQVRQDVILCVVFVLQSAPPGLLRALWRKLFVRSSGKGSLEKFGSLTYGNSFELSEPVNWEDSSRFSKVEAEAKESPDIFDVFSLLNVSLATVEYEGSDENVEIDVSGDSDGPLGFWRKEFLMTRDRDNVDTSRGRRMILSHSAASPVEEKERLPETQYATSSSRKWISHDSSIVLIRTVQQIVRELRYVLEPAEGSQSLFNPARRKAHLDKSHRQKPSYSTLESQDSKGMTPDLKFSYVDTVIFVRGATSVYLNSLVLRESDIALVKTLNASVELIKIFGIKIFNEAVGETLQHWLRMITFHCGSRRAEVRVPASDFCELILRSTWDCFGSFFRIRIPLLAVQTEVMERIVATAVARHYRDQRKMGHAIVRFSNASAEASLTPLWRTTDRLHHQPASQNVAFRSSLVRLAEKLKKLHRAYIAAHALSFQNRSRSPEFINEEKLEAGASPELLTLIRANRMSVIRVINASAGYSKQFLGLQGASLEHANLAHHEAVEEAFLEAADVFSPTELPDHRVAWLRKLAQFHTTRSKHAEEATCHYMIYHTLYRSSRLRGSLWCSTPFLPWIDNMSDGIHLEGPAGDPDDGSDFEIPELDYGRQIDKTNSFRRIFYRNENSIRLNAGELEAGTGKTAFFGASLTSEYLTTTPWITLREMEANMLEEAEAAGDFFSKSGIIASSRYMWSLVTKYYADKFMYGKLALVYDRLSRTVVSQVPSIDNTLQQEVHIGLPLGRFYRVWFHGGAPDELIGAEYVYRSAENVSIVDFGKELRDVLRCIIPAKTPIHLVLDGRPDDNMHQNQGGPRMGGAPLEPVKVKVTPLRPAICNASSIRGLPEWFKLYVDGAFTGGSNRRRAFNESGVRPTKSDAPHTHPSHRHATSVASAANYSNGNVTTATSSSNKSASSESRYYKSGTASEGELVGADKFWFMQPMNKDRSRGSRDWLKIAGGDFAEKTLRVTQLQVRQTFPACISRQAVIHRVVYTQSPLEAAVDVMCQWCAVLFRTTIACNGMVVLGTNSDPGIGIDAAKVISECIHSSKVKEMGLSLLKKNTNVEEEDDDVLHSYDRLAEEEIKKFQLKLARSFVVFMELLHLLISRNRDLLLDVIQSRRKTDAHPTSKQGRDYSIGSIPPLNKQIGRDASVGGSLATRDDRSRHGTLTERRPSIANESTSSSHDGRSREEASMVSNARSRTASEEYAGNTAAAVGDSGFDRLRTDSAIGIQRELQLAFINLAKDLYPMILGIMEGDTPRWLKQCCHDSYFSAYTYRQSKIPIGEEITFEDVNISSSATDDGFNEGRPTHIPRDSSSTVGERLGLIPNLSNADRSQPSQAPGSPGGSLASGTGSVTSRGSDAGKSARSRRSQKEVRQQNERLASC